MPCNNRHDKYCICHDMQISSCKKTRFALVKKYSRQGVRQIERLGMAEDTSSVFRKQSTVTGLNKVWQRVQHLALVKNFPRGSIMDISANLEFGGKPGFYYIISGKVRLSYIDAEGNERTILYAGPGNLMNVPSIMADDLADTFARCMENTRIAVFDAALLSDEAFAAQNPDLMLNLVRSLCVHLVIHSQRLADASMANTLAQICRWVLELARHNGERRCFAPNITQQELALLLGIHRTTLTRALARLRKMRVLGRFTKSSLDILDLEKLREIAGGNG